MSPPPQDVLAFDGFLGNTKYEAVPAGTAEEVVAHYERRARKFVLYRILGVVLAGVIGFFVLFRFTRSVPVSGGIAGAFVLGFGGLQLRALDQGVPEVVDREVPPGDVRGKYGVEPADADGGG
jgi:hypothetical protein